MPKYIPFWIIDRTNDAQSLNKPVNLRKVKPNYPDQQYRQKYDNQWTSEIQTLSPFKVTPNQGEKRKSTVIAAKEKKLEQGFRGAKFRNSSSANGASLPLEINALFLAL